MFRVTVRVVKVQDINVRRQQGQHYFAIPAYNPLSNHYKLALALHSPEVACSQHSTEVALKHIHTRPQTMVGIDCSHRHVLFILVVKWNGHRLVELQRVLRCIAVR